MEDRLFSLEVINELILQFELVADLVLHDLALVKELFMEVLDGEEEVGAVFRCYLHRILATGTIHNNFFNARRLPTLQDS